MTTLGNSLVFYLLDEHERNVNDKMYKPFHTLASTFCYMLGKSINSQKFIQKKILLEVSGQDNENRDYFLGHWAFLWAVHGPEQF